MKVSRASRWQYAVVLTVAVTVQPVAFALCQLNCLPHPVPAAKNSGDESRQGVPCHDHGGTRAPESSRSEQAAHSLSPVHACIHRTPPSVTRVVENAPRLLASSLAVAAASFEIATHARALPLRVTHAPPGQSALRTDVLRR